MEEQGYGLDVTDLRSAKSNSTIVEMANLIEQLNESVSTLQKVLDPVLAPMESEAPVAELSTIRNSTFGMQVESLVNLRERLAGVIRRIDL